MTDDDTEIRNVVLARDALRREAHLPPLDIEKEVEHAQRHRNRKVAAMTFIPHAIIITERSSPTQINSAGWFGISKLLRLSLDLNKSKDTFAQQALDSLSSRIVELDCIDWRGKIPWFGAPIFIVVNYSLNHAVRYDLNGVEIETLGSPIGFGYGAETIHLAKDHLSKNPSSLIPSQNYD